MPEPQFYYQHPALVELDEVPELSSKLDGK